jgi:hypothetical protein
MKLFIDVYLPMLIGLFFLVMIFVPIYFTNVFIESIGVDFTAMLCGLNFGLTFFFLGIASANQTKYTKSTKAI